MSQQERSSQPKGEPENRVSGRALLQWTALVIVGMGTLLAGLLVVVDRADWWQGLIAATVISVFAAIVGLFPVLLMAPRGNAQQISMSFLAGTLLRMMAAIALLMLALYIYNVPRVPTAVLLLAYYFAILGAEVGVLVVQMRRSFPPGKFVRLETTP